MSEERGETGRPAIDPAGFAALVEMIGPDMPEVVVDIVDTYQEEALALLGEIVPAAANNDAERMVRPVHSLKSSSGSVGAQTLSQLCADLESHLRGFGPPMDIAAQVAAIREEFERVSAELAVLREGLIEE